MRDAAPKDEEKGQKGQMCYIVEADDILPLGVKTVFHGQELYTGGICRHIRQGILVNEYRLYFRKEWRFHGTITRFCAACPSTARSQKSDETGSAQRWKMMR